MFVVEQDFRQSFAQFRFPYSRRSQKQERTDGSIDVLQSTPIAPDRIGDRFYGLLLADHPLVQAFFHYQQLCPLGFEHSCDGNTRPETHHLADFFFSDLATQ